MDCGDWITLTAVMVALGLGLSSLIQTHRLQKRERKERLLKEIVEWVTDIQKVSLEVDIPAIGSPLSLQQINANLTIVEANTLLRYGIPFIKNEYIAAIASKAFKVELEQDVQNMIHVFTAFLFLKTTAFGAKNLEEAFPGSAKITQEVKEQLKQKSPEQLHEEYATEMSKYAENLLKKTGSIMATL